MGGRARRGVADHRRKRCGKSRAGRRARGNADSDLPIRSQTGQNVRRQMELRRRIAGDRDQHRESIMSEKFSAVKRLIELEIEKAKKFMGSAVAAEVEAVEGAVKGAYASHDCACSIPTPCWLPEDLGDRDVSVEAGSTARLTLRVRNIDGQQQQVTANVSGSGSQFVMPVNASVIVRPFGWGTFTFSVAVPPAAAGTYIDVQIAIQGCRRHILNWRVDVVEKCAPNAKTDH